MKKYVFQHGDRNPTDWANITRNMESILNETIQGNATETELNEFVSHAIQDARPAGRGLFWGFDEPQNMPSDARCEFFYRPTYIMTLTLINAILQHPSLLDMPSCKETVHGALIGCTGRGLQGHGFDSQAELYDNLKLFLRSNILAFLVAYPDLGNEFSEMLSDIMQEVRRAYEQNEHVGDWNHDFKKDQEEVLDLYPVIDPFRDRIIYFAYGSNMDENQMVSRCPSARMLGVVGIPRYRFALDAKDYATIIPDAESHVEGILWSVRRDDVRELDRREGVTVGCYRKASIPVDDYREGLTALVYISRRPLTPRLANEEYMARIIRAAIKNHFSESYIEMLKGFYPERHDRLM